MADEDAELSRFQKFIGAGQSAIGLVAAAVGVASAVWSSYSAAHSQERSEASQASAARAAQDAQKIQTQIEFNKDNRERVMTVYKEVNDALASKSQAREDAALALVKLYLAGEPDFQNELASVLQKSGGEAVQKDAAIYRFDLQNQVQSVSDAVAGSPAKQVAAKGPGQLGGYRVDVFRCEDSPAGVDVYVKGLAQRLAGYTSGMVRARVLPAAVNVPPSYGIHGLVIRYEANEKGVADELYKLAGSDLAAAGYTKSQPLQLQQVAFRTPSYLSLFVCPRA